MKKYLVILLLTIMGLFFVNRTFAQEVSLSLSPSIQEVVALPGKTIIIDYNLTNLADPQQIMLSLVSLQPHTDDTLKIKSVLDPVFKASLAGNVTANEPFFLKGKEKKEFSVILQIPQSIQEKDYYLGVLAQSQAPPTTEGDITVRNQLGLIGSIFLTITHDGSIETKPRIVEFDVSTKKKVNFFGTYFAVITAGEKTPLLLKVGNQGKNMLKAQGLITVQGMGPKKNLTISPQRIYAYSESVVFSPSIPGFLFGPFKIAATLNFGPSSPVLYATTNVFILPSKSMLAIILVIVFISIYFWRIFLKKSKR